MVLKTTVPFPRKFILISRMKTSVCGEEANTKYIRKSRRLVVRKACSRCDLELVKIKSVCLVPDSCKSLG